MSTKKNKKHNGKKKDPTDSGSLVKIIVKAMEYANRDPETSLMYARKSAEAICIKIFTSNFGAPKTTKLDDLITLLVQKGIIPEKIKIPMRTVQQYGNYGSHMQPNSASIDRLYIDPCLLALIQVTNWYFHELLEAEIPPEIIRLNNDYTPRDKTDTRIIDDIAKGLALPFPLRSYQWEGVRFLYERQSALLADEMGLGKTPQAIVALRLYLQKSVSRRVLIVTPASLVYNWERELRVWAPDLTIRRVNGNAIDRHATYQLPIQVLIANYEQIRADAIDMDNDICFDLVILDEAQRIKNHNATTSLGCRLLNRSSSWVLTGTPLENNLSDLYSIFLFMNPGLLTSGMSPREVHMRIRDFFLRRRKTEVLKELPPIITQDILLELSGDQREEYDDFWLSRKELIRSQGSPVSEAALFALITELKQICNFATKTGQSVKLDMLKVILEDLSEPDDKILIFSQYVETLKKISSMIPDFPHAIYHGKQSQQEREQVLQNFKIHSGPRALLMSLRAGGVGLNIQEASTVVLFDRWWNPAVEEQAINRAHRFGREKPLHVIRFLVADSIEERIQQILQDKQIEFDKYIEQAESAPVKLFARNELRKILGLTPFDIDSYDN